MANMYENDQLKPIVKRTAKLLAEMLNKKHGQEEDGRKRVAFRDGILMTKITMDMSPSSQPTAAMNTLVLCAALSAISVIAHSPNQQPNLQSWMNNLNHLDASVLAQQITRSNIEAGQFLLPSLPRTTRDANDYAVKSCCDVEYLKFEHIQKYMDDCEDSRTQSKGIFTCVGLAAGVSDAEGKITDLDKFGEMMAKMYEDYVLMRTVKVFAVEFGKIANKYHGQEVDGQKRIGLYMAFILTTSTVDMSCVESMRIKSDYCDRVREQYKKQQGH
ncbi:hypothetical protein L9F63_017278 [Diploptera punctata]|uniref:Uncharacterized protein n=1 Tax=Diploptera punctata TaxID=6984 RepID=A0AAD8EGX9_DIPPU|nr:hypothetical protein L9F63_017278 [Diploptera punctata]